MYQGSLPILWRISLLDPHTCTKARCLYSESLKDITSRPPYMYQGALPILWESEGYHFSAPIHDVPRLIAYTLPILYSSGSRGGVMGFNPPPPLRGWCCFLLVSIWKFPRTWTPPPFKEFLDPPLLYMPMDITSPPWLCTALVLVTVVWLVMGDGGYLDVRSVDLSVSV